MSQIAQRILSASTLSFAPVKDVLIPKGESSNVLASPRVRDGINEMHELIRSRHAEQLALIDELEQMSERATTLTDRSDIWMQRRKVLQDIMDSEPLPSFEPQGQIDLTRLDLFKWRDVADAHAIARMPEMVSLLAMSKKIEKYPIGLEVFVIPPILLDDADARKIYDRFIAPHSTCLFNEREHPEMFTTDEHGTFAITGKDDMLSVDDVPASVCVAAILHHVDTMPYAALTYQDRNEYLPPCPRLDALVVPDDVCELKDAAQTIESQIRQGYFSARAAFAASKLSYGSLPDAVCELISRASVMYPLWERMLPSLYSLDDETIRFDKAYEELGIESCLDAIASGVPLEDVIA